MLSKIVFITYFLSIRLFKSIYTDRYSKENLEIVGEVQYFIKFSGIYYEKGIIWQQINVKLLMRKYILICILAVMASSCGVSRKIDVLEKCNYSIKSADSVYLAGKDISKIFKNKKFDLNNLPGLALALFRKNIPLSANVKISITNPNQKTALINQFDYIILIKGQELAAGSVDRKISIESGSTGIIPVQINSNVYSFLSNGKTMEELIAFMGGTESGPGEKKSLVTIKIRPSFIVGNKSIKYPGYISIEKELSSKMLF